MPVVLGLDLGTRHPARATLHLGGRKPVLVGSSRGDFRKFDTRVRVEASFAWLERELQLAWASNIRTVAIEDPRSTVTGMVQRGTTNAQAMLLLLQQFAQVSLLAKTMGFTVVAVEPRSVSARIGLKLTPKASVSQRRREKKAQTKRWVELCVVNGIGLTEDECDAVAIAYAGWRVGGRK